MFENIADVVIIPHPNQHDILLKLQSCLSAIKDSFIIPEYPIYIPVPFKNLKEKITSVKIYEIETDNTTIFCPVTVSTGTQTITTRLTLASFVNDEKKDCAYDRHILQSFSFPLTINVFKIANLTYTKDNSSCSWSVQDFKWVKIKKITP